LTNTWLVSELIKCGSRVINKAFQQNNAKTKYVTLKRWPSRIGVRRNISREVNIDISLTLSGLLTMQNKWTSQNALPFLHHKENSRWNHALRSRFFEIVFRWSCIRVCEKVALFSSFIAFAECGYHPISLLLWTADNWAWIGLELSTTAFAVLT